jgi:hypothetical protein
MGVYNMFVLLGCISIAVSGTYIPMLIWGKKTRQWRAEKYEYYMKRQYGLVSE